MYEKEIFLLDLCILAYQLHAQTLLCPLDPYTEQLTPPNQLVGYHNIPRHGFFASLRAFYTRNPPPVPLRGPGEFCGSQQDGWAANNTLDPIFSDYSRVNPWMPAVVFARPGECLVYDAPRDEITNRIAGVYVARYTRTHGPMHGSPACELFPSATAAIMRPVTIPVNPQRQSDLLYCFEGGTGALGDSAPAMSLMGFVLVRQTQRGYDIHIVFRGSRSGALRMHQAAVNARGNPDWVTDTGTRPVRNSHISPGMVYEGFERATHFTLPCVIECLAAIAAKKGNAPDRIFVAGHSLGGALACYFASAINAGDRYGPDGNGLPQPLNNWPWARLELLTFGAPRLGNDVFRDEFNAAVNCQRIRLRNDPIPDLGLFALLPSRRLATTDERGRHVGAYWRLPKADTASHAHDPAYIRRALLTWYSGRPHALPVRAPGGVNPAEPWQTFDTVDAALGWIDSHLPGYSTVNLFDGYALALANYLRVLRGILSPGDQAILTTDVIGNLERVGLPRDETDARTRLNPVRVALLQLSICHGNAPLRAFFDAWLKLAAMGSLGTLRWQTVRGWYAS